MSINYQLIQQKPNLFYFIQIFTKKKHKHNITITINNNNIKQVKNTTFLGIIIDKCKMSRFDVYADRETADSLERHAQQRQESTNGHNVKVGTRGNPPRVTIPNPNPNPNQP